MKDDKFMDEINAVYMQCGLLTESGEFIRKVDVPNVPKMKDGHNLFNFNTNRSAIKDKI